MCLKNIAKAGLLSPAQAGSVVRNSLAAGYANNSGKQKHQRANGSTSKLKGSMSELAVHKVCSAIVLTYGQVDASAAKVTVTLGCKPKKHEGKTS
jgi:hypothetical protein